jgi:hypothetical protein
MFHSNLHMIISCCILSDPSGIDVQGGGEGKRGSCPRILELCNRYQFSASEREMFHLMVVVQGSCDAHVLVSYFPVRTYGLFCLVLLCAPTPVIILSCSLLYSTVPFCLPGAPFFSDFLPSTMCMSCLTISSLYLTHAFAITVFHYLLCSLLFSPSLSFSLSLQLPPSVNLSVTSPTRLPVSSQPLFCTPFLNRISTSLSTVEHSSGRGLFAPHQRVPAIVGHERGGH